MLTICSSLYRLFHIESPLGHLTLVLQVWVTYTFATALALRAVMRFRSTSGINFIASARFLVKS
jgi:hypothetical protein